MVESQLLTSCGVGVSGSFIGSLDHRRVMDPDSFIQYLRSESFYDADKDAPDNAQVIITRNAGLKGCRVLYARTPNDVVTILGSQILRQCWVSCQVS